MSERGKLKARVSSVMEDPGAHAVAGVYAESLVNAAEKVGVEEVLEEFASFIDDVLARNPDFTAVLLSGMVNRDQKVELIERVLKNRSSELFFNFLKVLAKHDRLELLPLILEESQLQFEQRQGRGRVQVTTAFPLKGEALEKVQQRLASSLPFKPILETKTDPALLGGLVIRVGDTVYDGSLQARLKQLRARLRQRSLHEIQSGRDRFSYPSGD